ncbi:MAG: hypothetical protein KDE27_24665 [Planctomycetes bacterium]|nr:hypothetical protein [Planctomycetota bacterium]
MKASAVVFGLLSVSLSAQATWIVDSQGGGNFSDLAVAIAAASPNDTLLIRNGPYPGQFALDKAIHLVGDAPQTPWIGRLSVSTPSGIDLSSFRNLAIDYVYGGTPMIYEGVAVGAVHVLNGASASFHHCTLGRGATPSTAMQISQALLVEGGNVVLNDCVVRGNFGYSQWPLCTLLPGYAIHVSYGSVTIADSAVHGADSNPVAACPGFSPPGVGILAWNGTVRVTRSTVSGGLDQNNTLADAFLVAAPAVLLRDPSATFVPATTLGTTVFQPATAADGAPPGGAITCTVRSDPSLPAVLVAGLGLRAPVSTPYGPAWLDPTANVILRIGFTDAAGVMAATIGLPATAPTNLPLTFQGLVVASGGTDLALGAPAIVQVL